MAVIIISLVDPCRKKDGEALTNLIPRRSMYCMYICRSADTESDQPEWFRNERVVVGLLITLLSRLNGKYLLYLAEVFPIYLQTG